MKGLKCYELQTPSFIKFDIEIQNSILNFFWKNFLPPKHKVLPKEIQNWNLFQIRFFIKAILVSQKWIVNGKFLNKEVFPKSIAYGLKTNSFENFIFRMKLSQHIALWSEMIEHAL